MSEIGVQCISSETYARKIYDMRFNSGGELVVREVIFPTYALKNYDIPEIRKVLRYQDMTHAYPYPVMRKGLCYFSTKKHHKKARFRTAFAREMARVKNILLSY